MSNLSSGTFILFRGKHSNNCRIQQASTQRYTVIDRLTPCFSILHALVIANETEDRLIFNLSVDFCYLTVKNSIN